MPVSCKCHPDDCKEEGSPGCMQLAGKYYLPAICIKPANTTCRLFCIPQAEEIFRQRCKTMEFLRRCAPQDDTCKKINLAPSPMRIVGSRRYKLISYISILFKITELFSITACKSFTFGKLYFAILSISSFESFEILAPKIILQ